MSLNQNLIQRVFTYIFIKLCRIEEARMLLSRVMPELCTLIILVVPKGQNLLAVTNYWRFSVSGMVLCLDWSNGQFLLKALGHMFPLFHVHPQESIEFEFLNLAPAQLSKQEGQLRGSIRVMTTIFSDSWLLNKLNWQS